MGRYGLEAKETITFFKLCEKLKEDNIVNNAILKLCHNSLLGIIDRKRVEENKIRKEENMKKAIDLMVERNLNDNWYFLLDFCHTCLIVHTY